jgi:hypothetical protein
LFNKAHYIIFEEAVMNKKSKSRSFVVITVLLLVSFLLSPFIGTTAPGKISLVKAASFDTRVYLPLIPQKFPIQTVFGAGMDQITTDWGMDMMAAARSSWTRTTGIVWSDVEKTEGNYDWSVLADLETELKDAYQNGLKVIMIVHGTPEWARKIPGSGPTCGPIAANKLTAFGNFMYALVNRYKKAPYNIKYWELWNEEDVDPAIFVGDSGFGCWGDPNDTYFGGGYYARMLKTVYPQMKAADPLTNVLVGGLLLDCDPRGGCAAVGKKNLAGMFLEGILRNGGGNYFDGISYHAYDFYVAYGVYGNTNWRSAWNTTGPVSITKGKFIYEMLDEYGVTGKFLMNTEAALVCGSTGNEPKCKTEDFQKTKVYYVAQSYASGISLNLRANIWYSVMGWRASALLTRSLKPLPSYNAYNVSRTELGDSTFGREITQYPGLKGYEFNRIDRRIWVIWSLDGATHTINMSRGPLAAYDALGNPVPTGKSMDVTLNPLYFEWNP